MIDFMPQLLDLIGIAPAALAIIVPINISLAETVKRFINRFSQDDKPVITGNWTILLSIGTGILAGFLATGEGVELAMWQQLLAGGVIGLASSLGVDFVEWLGEATLKRGELELPKE